MDNQLPDGGNAYHWMQEHKVEPTLQQLAVFAETASEFPLCVHHCPCIPWQIPELARREIFEMLFDSIGDLRRPLDARLSDAADHEYLDDSTVKLLPLYKVDTMMTCSCEEDLNAFITEQNIMCASSEVQPEHHSWPHHWMFFEVASDKYVLVSVYQPEQYHNEDYIWLISSDQEIPDGANEPTDAAQDEAPDEEAEGDADEEASGETGEDADEQNDGNPLPLWLLHPGGSLYVEQLAAEAEEWIPHANYTYEGAARRLLF